jgi:ABC-type bacteriocin/lantibiotic exporter with double-glycine peptidase domain
MFSSAGIANFRSCHPRTLFCRLRLAIMLANLSDYLHMLPNEVETVVGAEGQGLSGGQRQRLLLAGRLSQS